MLRPGVLEHPALELENWQKADFMTVGLQGQTWYLWKTHLDSITFPRCPGSHLGNSEVLYGRQSVCGRLRALSGDTLLESVNQA